MTEATPPRRPTHVHGLLNPHVMGFVFLGGTGVRVTDLQGRTAVFPVYSQDGGRCAEN